MTLEATHSLQKHEKNLGKGLFFPEIVVVRRFDRSSCMDLPYTSLLVHIQYMIWSLYFQNFEEMQCWSKEAYKLYLAS